jgi:hypothetical protein
MPKELGETGSFDGEEERSMIASLFSINVARCCDENLRKGIPKLYHEEGKGV